RLGEGRVRVYYVAKIVKPLYSFILTVGSIVIKPFGPSPGFLDKTGAPARHPTSALCYKHS
ncbi:MAG: hypothetical protein ACUVTR_06975, partial [Dehalococcoidia bacterium]